MSLNDLRRRAMRPVNLNPRCCVCGVTMDADVKVGESVICSDECEDEDDKRQMEMLRNGDGEEVGGED